MGHYDDDYEYDRLKSLGLVEKSIYGSSRKVIIQRGDYEVRQKMLAEKAIKDENILLATWYLLYAAKPDAIDTWPEYVGRTIDPQVAIDHLRKIRKNSKGFVRTVDDRNMGTINSPEMLEHIINGPK